jgi:hypothetical protein
VFVSVSSSSLLNAVQPTLLTKKRESNQNESACALKGEGERGLFEVRKKERNGEKEKNIEKE